MKKLILCLLCAPYAWAQESSWEALQAFQYSDEQRCYVDGLPIMPLLVASSHGNQDLLRSALDEALARGCDINAARPDEGLNALNTAILLRETAWLQFLLERGANPDLKINAPERIYHGLNSREFAALLYQKTQKPIYRDLEALLP